MYRITVKFLLVFLSSSRKLRESALFRPRPLQKALSFITLYSTHTDSVVEYLAWKATRYEWKPAEMITTSRNKTSLRQ